MIISENDIFNYALIIKHEYCSGRKCNECIFFDNNHKNDSNCLIDRNPLKWNLVKIKERVEK